MLALYNKLNEYEWCSTFVVTCPANPPDRMMTSINLIKIIVSSRRKSATFERAKAFILLVAY